MLSRSLRLLAKFRSGLKPGNDFSLEVEGKQFGRASNADEQQGGIPFYLSGLAFQ